MAGGKKEDKNKIMQDKLEAHETKFKELEELITTQKETIQGLKDQQVQLEQDAQAAKVRVFYVQVFGMVLKGIVYKVRKQIWGRGG